MKDIQFLSYEEVVGEKHLGIATIRKRFYDADQNPQLVIFRVKISPKDGGYWTQAAAYKITKNGKESYASSFQFDSQYDSEQIKEFILEHVEKHYQDKSVQKNISTTPFVKQPVQIDMFADEQTPF